MLMNRSGGLTCKQAIMSSPNKNSTPPISSFFGSRRFVYGFESQTDLYDHASPNSLLDTKNSSNVDNPFGSGKVLHNTHHELSKFLSERIGLALVDSFADDDEDEDNSFKPVSRMVKVQIPTSSVSPIESPKSPSDFGIKTRNLHHFLGSPVKESPRGFTRQLSLKEMEDCEEYTCVITHGPNPKTTHIFDDCIVDELLWDFQII